MKLISSLVIFLLLAGGIFAIFWTISKDKADGKINIRGMSRALAFGITLIFFYAWADKFFNLLTNLAIDGPYQLSLGNSTIANLNGSQSQLIDQVRNFPYTTLILFAITWVVVTLCIDQVLRRDDKNPVNIFRDNRVAKNVFVCLVVFFALYLSTASIIAIPEFQALENTTVDKQELGNFKLSMNDSTLKMQMDGLAFSLNYPPDSGLSELAKHHLNLFRVDMQSFTQAVDDMRKDLSNKQQMVLLAFQTALEEKTMVKQRDHYRSALAIWYVRQQNPLLLLTKEKAILSRYMPNLVSKVSTADARLKDKKDSAVYEVLDKEYEGITAAVKQLNGTVYDSLAAYPQLPKRPGIGEEFGIFQAFSGWLLQTESMSLALIVGLFAFGLLGSIGSSFIRQQMLKKGEEIIDYVPNLPTVLISGISSAIVVFLAVKGSIVVFASKDASLNPYVLFFICLVSAVYSEDIWAWAHVKLQETIARKAATVAAAPLVPNEPVTAPVVPAGPVDQAASEPVKPEGPKGI